MASVKRKETTVQGARGQVRRSRSSHALREACGSYEIRLMALRAVLNSVRQRKCRWQTWAFSRTRDHDSDSDGRRGPHGDRADARDIETDREKTHRTNKKGSTLMMFFCFSNHDFMNPNARTTMIGTRTAVADPMATARTLATVKPTVILFHRTTNQTSTLKLFASSNS